MTRKRKEREEVARLRHRCRNKDGSAIVVDFKAAESQTHLRSESSISDTNIGGLHFESVGFASPGNGNDSYAVEVHPIKELEQWVVDGNHQKWLDLPVPVNKILRPTERYIKGARAFFLAAGEFFTMYPCHGRLLEKGMIMVNEVNSEVFMTIKIPSDVNAELTQEEIGKKQNQDMRTIVFGTIFDSVPMDKQYKYQRLVNGVTERVDENDTNTHHDFKVTVPPSPPPPPGDRVYQDDLLLLYLWLTPMSIPREATQKVQKDTRKRIASQLRDVGQFGYYPWLWSSHERKSFVHNLMDQIEIAHIDNYMQDGKYNTHSLTDIELELDRMGTNHYENWKQMVHEFCDTGEGRGDHVLRRMLKKKKRDESGSEFTSFVDVVLRHARDWEDSEKNRGESNPQPRRMKRSYLVTQDDRERWLGFDDFDEIRLSQVFPLYIVHIYQSVKGLDRYHIQT